MATPAMWQFDDLLQCMICFESYRSPKMLKCGHTFCADCLTGYQQTYQQQRRAVPGKLPCPTCRELTTLPAAGVAGLRTDFKVQKIEDLFKTMNIHNRPVSTSCGSCQTQNKSCKADVYCTVCMMSYCDPCLKKHNKNTLFKSHKVVASSTAASTTSPDMYCKTHPGEKGNYLCKSCETIICTLCVMSDHSDHEVCEMNAVVRQQQDDIRNLRNLVQKKNEALKKRAVELDTLRSVNQRSCQQTELAIKEKAVQMIEAVRRSEATLLEELFRRKNEKVSRLDRELERVKYNISKTQVTGEFATLTSRSNLIRVLGTHDELIQRMRTVVDAASTVGVDGGEIQSILTFLPGRNDPDLGRMDEMRSSMEELGRLEKETSSQAAAKRNSAITRSISMATPNPVMSPGISPSNLKPKLLMCVNSHGTQVGEIRDPLGLACLLNGDVVVTEWSNQRLQVFDPSGHSVQVIAPGLIGPQGIGVTLKGNIIISDTMQKRLQVFSPDGVSLSKWGLGKFFSPCGVTISPNGNFIISDTEEHSVSIFRGEKTCVRRFGTLGSKDDQFDNPLYVTTGLHNEVIVSDSNNHCLKMFDSTGRFLRRIGSEGSDSGQFKFPRGICTDHEGNIVVADRNNDRVCLLSSHGRFLRHLLTKEDGIRSPYAVGITVTGNLMITESSSNRAAIKMFQL